MRSSLTTGACRAPDSSFLRDHQLQLGLCIFTMGRENFMAASEDKGMTNTVVKEGRVKADNCCKTLSPLLPHAQEIRAVKSLGWAPVMTFQISSSTAMQISGTKSYHSLCGNSSRSSAQRQGSKAGTWFCHNKPSLATVTSLPGNLANKQTHPLALPPRWHAEPTHAEKQGKSPGTEELWDARWPW